MSTHDFGNAKTQLRRYTIERARLRHQVRSRIPVSQAKTEFGLGLLLTE